VTSAERPWYETAFGPDYPTVYPHRDLDAARREIAELVASTSLAGRVLDLACGFGRHTLALLEQGLDAVGVDLSASLLAGSRGLAGGERLAGRLVRADARALPFPAATFDGVANLFSSFGYFGEEGDGRVLAEVSRVLRPGALAVLDLMNPARVRQGLVPRSISTRGAARLTEERSLAAGGARVVKVVTLEVPGEPARTWREDVRMYDASEMRSLGSVRGLTLVAVLGNFAGEPFVPAAERQILVFRRNEVTRIPLSPGTPLGPGA